MKRIHFVCRGNIYRSRLAEAYTKSLLSEKDREYISSSGIEADLERGGDISDVVSTLLEEDSAEAYGKPRWTQITQAQVDSTDIIVFMTDTVYKDAQKFLDIPSKKAVVWSIPDTGGIYPDIKQNVKELLSEVL